MQIIERSAEDYFVIFLDKIRGKHAGWLALHIAYARRTNHAALLGRPEDLARALEEMVHQGDKVAERILTRRDDFPGADLYRFADGDVMLVYHPSDKAEQDRFYGLFQDLSATVPHGLVEVADIGRDVQGAHRLSERKLLARERMEGYGLLTDANRLGSIAIRRQKRDRGLIMIVEDDRFTANYTVGVLGREYDIIQVCSGERAVLDYIAHAPDMVLLDIHLQGLDGLETLLALRVADPASFVVMVSVDTVKENIFTATERGAAGFLKKPFSKERLMSFVQECPFLRRFSAGVKQG